jgi:hypothetical protein
MPDTGPATGKRDPYSLDNSRPRAEWLTYKQPKPPQPPALPGDRAHLVKETDTGQVVHKPGKQSYPAVPA